MRTTTIHYPEAGTLRVSRSPEHLPGPLKSGGDDPAIAAGSRFDDPLREFLVRYTATNLRGCLVQTMARFRPSPDAEVVLAAIRGIDDDDLEPNPVVGLADWFDRQKVGRVRICDPTVGIIDVDVAATLVDLDKHPLVRQTLEASPLSTALVAARLDESVVRLPGEIGRPITQAVSRAIFEWQPDVGVLGYWSRLDGSERCWAIFDRCPVEVTVLSPLSPDEPEHLDGVHSVASLYEINLPDAWR
jgi:hypothetical protein